MAVDCEACHLRTFDCPVCRRTSHEVFRDRVILLYQRASQPARDARAERYTTDWRREVGVRSLRLPTPSPASPRIDLPDETTLGHRYRNHPLDTTKPFEPTEAVGPRDVAAREREQERDEGIVYLSPSRESLYPSERRRLRSRRYEGFHT